MIFFQLSLQSLIQLLYVTVQASVILFELLHNETKTLLLTLFLLFFPLQSSLSSSPLLLLGSPLILHLVQLNALSLSISLPFSAFILPLVFEFSLVFLGGSLDVVQLVLYCANFSLLEL